MILKKDIQGLSVIAKRVKAKVNLIGYNEVADCAYRSPIKKEMDVFSQALRNKGVRVTVRYSAGSDISAACGQLRLKKASIKG